MQKPLKRKSAEDSYSRSNQEKIIIFLIATDIFGLIWMIRKEEEKGNLFDVGKLG